jgi:hypothetical protein
MSEGQAVRKPSAGRKQTPVSDPEFRGLLDHLGRLLAHEYVALLTTVKTPEAMNSQGTKS